MTTTATPVREVMTADVVTVRSFATFRQIATMMLGRGIGAVPVVDSMGQAIGVVSRTDLIAKQAMGAPGQSEAWERLSRRGRQIHDRGGATTAARLMATDLVTVRADTDVAEAAYLMERHAITHLPVIDTRNTVVGIVSRSDLLRAYLRDDSQIRADVTRMIEDSESKAPVGAVEVEVVDGIVTLSGTLDHSPAAVRLIRGVQGVRGVVDVVDKLNWLKNCALPADAFDPGPLF
ncbi:MAG: CBS domain-containing protein [Actinocrinis sp.]